MADQNSAQKSEQTQASTEQAQPEAAAAPISTESKSEVASTQQDAQVDNRSPADDVSGEQDAELKALTESVQEEIKGEGDSFTIGARQSNLANQSSIQGEDEAADATETQADGPKSEPPKEPKHQLLNEWSFWYVYSMSHRDKKKARQMKRNDYELREVYSFETIEDFWHMYNNLYSVSEIISNTDYLLFKKGIRPEWEDPENKLGGKWVVTMPIEDDLEEDSETAWLQLILHLISGQFTKEQRAVINGIVFSIRDKHMRISIWCSVSKETALLQGIGHKLRQVTQIDPQYRFGFQEHQKAIKHDLDNQNFLEV